MIEKLALVYIEIDIRTCSLSYGDSPCTAQIGVTGDDKCFNTRNQRADCQDAENFTEATKTLRFGLRDVGYLPSDILCYPLLDKASVNNGVLKPGESIGERSTLTATFHNGRSGDAGLDPYVTERGYIAFDQGTFWGKFRARNTYLEGRPMRIIRGYVGQSLAEMDTEHFVIDSMNGPNSSGKVTIKASDFMRLLNSEKALAPIPNSGRLDADYLTGSSSVTLEPSGIGDIEYPVSGRVAIGKEVFDFTRVLDDLSLSPSMAEDHKVGEIAQQTLFYDGEKASRITADLIENFSPLDSSYTNEPQWEDLVDTYADLLYTREVVKPTPTRTLLNELIVQAGLVIFGDTREQVVSFDILKANPSTGDTITGEKMLRGSFAQKDQPNKRFSEIVVYYDKRDDFASDEPQNYFSAALYVVPDDQYPTPNVLRIFSKWIRSDSLSIAQDVAVMAAARYKFPPLEFRFDLEPQNKRGMGQVVTISHPAIESATGAQGEIDAIVTGVSDRPDKNSLVLEEYNIDADLLAGDRVIQFEFSKNNINLLDEYYSRYATLDMSTPPVIFRFIGGVVVGSSSIDLPGLDTGIWPATATLPKIEIYADAFLVGRGGNSQVGDVGLDGGLAMRVQSPFTVDNLGTIGGGGGGGGGSILGLPPFTRYSGGGGAGEGVGIGANNGTLENGGLGGDTNSETRGGDLGQDGFRGTSGPLQFFDGGEAGDAIDGVSNITFTNTGTILGDQIG